jgi:hypothetical protein
MSKVHEGHWKPIKLSRVGPEIDHFFMISSFVPCSENEAQVSVSL